jgi:sodium/bile acid cotransporter 7
MKSNIFIVFLIGMIVLAYLVPAIATSLPLEQISKVGISGIFFFYGLKLSPEKLRADLSNWKLHLLIQITTFVLFPFLVIAAFPFMNAPDQKTLWIAVFFLAALPSTVSSSVVMVSIAKGNVTGAIFNASISGLIGIVITPLWISLFATVSGEAPFQIGASITALVIRILLPVFLGMALHGFWGKYAEKHRKTLAIFDQSVILIIVYKSFVYSFGNQTFQPINIINLTIVALGAVSLFVLVFLMVSWVARKLAFTREDRITAEFCASKKSLVHGSVFAEVLFGGAGAVGIFLVPIMIYHTFQLLVISIIAGRYASHKQLGKSKTKQ